MVRSGTGGLCYFTEAINDIRLGIGYKNTQICEINQEFLVFFVQKAFSENILIFNFWISDFGDGLLCPSLW